MRIEDLYSLIVTFKKETKESLIKLTHRIITLENTVLGYGDMYKINKDDINKFATEQTL